MPTAPKVYRDQMHKWFGDPICEQGPIKYLSSKGYKLLNDYSWEPPVSAHSVSCYEWQCILFLIYEWDFGGLIGGGPTVCLCGEKEKLNA